MEKGKVLHREKLTKKFYMQHPEGLYLVSNIHDNRFQSIFEEVITSLNQREEQWKRIVSAGASQKLCCVFKTKENYDTWLGDAKYKPDKKRKMTLH
ncbi:MAG TPA: hypothetical protein PK178_07495 [Smithellaceae bacterium]|jgi:hypothetical protein|nr:hypothetical protein [Smithellaceae bacterium]HQP56643.1 hypothetical protein [Syntrophorhabdus sp.]